MRRARLCLLFVVSAFLVHGQASPTETYVVMIAGTAAGKLTQTNRSDGTIEVFYSYNDRGRGPEVRAVYRMDSRGFPSRIDITGSDYYKAPVDEHLSVSGGKATWKSTSEAGTAASDGFFLSMNGAPDEIAWLVNALQRTSAHQLKLLPGGEARLQRGRTATLKQGGGQTISVTQFLMTGLDFAPTSVWLDRNNRFFATVDPGWNSVIRNGWESSIDDLGKLQDDEADSRYRMLAQRLSRRSNAITIRHVRLFDSVNAAIKDDQIVRISSGRIQMVGPDKDFTPVGGEELIDGSGKTLLPGLWDMHVHTQPSSGILNLASGVTSVRDMGNDIDLIARLKKQWDSGETIGPRLFVAGIVDGRGPYQAPTKVFADEELEARAVVQRYASLGYQQIKVYSSLKPELVAPIAALAHSNGMRLSGHVPYGMTAEQFIRSGADEIQHLNFIFLNFMADKAGDTRTPARFTVPAENATALDVNSAAVTAFIDLLKDRKIVIDPTLGVFEGRFTDRPGEVSESWAPVVSRLPLQLQRAARAGGLPAPGEKDKLYKESFMAFLKMQKRLYDSGIPLVAGTDGVEGLMLHRELELWVKAGIPAAKVLQAATLGAAKVVKADAELGSIEPGKKADLALVDGNPLSNISDIRRVRFVIKNGVEFQSAELYATLGIRQ